MPFIHHTPEFLIARNDSRNPATTCRGITATGRPCRRAVGKAEREAAGLRASVALFCWQHRDQVQDLKTSSNVHVLKLQHRSSVETLLDRLGILQLDDANAEIKVRAGHDGTVRRSRPVPQTQREKPATADVALAVPDIQKPSPKQQFAAQPRTNVRFETDRPPRRPRPRHGDLNLSLLCCMSSPEVYTAAPRIAQPHPVPPTRARVPVHAQPRPLLSYIPPSTPPGIMASLLTELAKPFGPSDAEAGYIYIFWLTPNSVSDQMLLHTQGMLAFPVKSAEHHATHKTSAGKVIAADKSTVSPARTIMLKIGRAGNVQRRMNEWTRQCGQHLSLLRYYPQPASNARHKSEPRLSSELRKVPRVARVERLIHLELSTTQIRRDCTACGRGHREWFEVDATAAGLRVVDSVVRRWVEWGLTASEEGK